MLSVQNWNRAEEEVNALMDLLVSTTWSAEELFEQGVAFNTTGIEQMLRNAKFTKEARDASPSDCKLELTLLLTTVRKWEITFAVKSIIDDGSSLMKLSLDHL